MSFGPSGRFEFVHLSGPRVHLRPRDSGDGETQHRSRRPDHEDRAARSRWLKPRPGKLCYCSSGDTTRSAR